MKDAIFPAMCNYLEPSVSGDYFIEHFRLTEQVLKFSQLRDTINCRREHSGQKPGVIVQLRDRHGSLMMSDAEMERRTNLELVRKANGDVLIAGLGLGMVLLPLQAKEEVASITVLEIHQEIIDMVAPQLPLNAKVQVICGDIFEWYPPKGVKYDTIYFDIWNDVCTDNYEGMKKLHRRFARRLNRDNDKAWMSSWRYDEIKARVRRERQFPYY